MLSVSLEFVMKTPRRSRAKVVLREDPGTETNFFLSLPNRYGPQGQRITKRITGARRTEETLVWALRDPRILAWPSRPLLSGEMKRQR